MYTLQLSDTIFVEMGPGDLYVYDYGNNNLKIVSVTDYFRPIVNEYTKEIISFTSKRHFRFRRQGPSYWWEEVEY